MPKKNATAGWGQCKAVLAKWPRPGVVALIQELYQLSSENRQFLHGRLLPQKLEATLMEAEKKLKQMVSARAAFGRGISQQDLKRFVDQFEKAVDDPVPVARLLVTDIDASCETFHELGDYEEMADHIYASMSRLDECLQICDVEPAQGVVADLEEVAARWADKFGYGVSDELVGLAEHWHGKLQMGDQAK